MITKCVCGYSHNSERATDRSMDANAGNYSFGLLRGNADVYRCDTSRYEVGGLFVCPVCDTVKSILRKDQVE